MKNAKAFLVGEASMAAMAVWVWFFPRIPIYTWILRRYPSWMRFGLEIPKFMKVEQVISWAIISVGAVLIGFICRKELS